MTKGPEIPLHIQAAQGSEEALSKLYQESVDGLYAFVLYRVGGERHLAEDVVQETFLWALDDLTRFDPTRGSFLSWLCVSSRNIIRRHLRESRRGQELQTMWDRIDQALMKVYASLEEAPLSDEILERRETQALVQLSIAQLPPHYRAALERHYLEGEGLKEVGSWLKVSEDAAKSLLARVRRAFRETFVTLARAMSEAKP